MTSTPQTNMPDGLMQQPEHFAISEQPAIPEPVQTNDSSTPSIAERERLTQEATDFISELRPQLYTVDRRIILSTRIPVLDTGSVQLRDYMGTDQLIEEAARQSYGQGTRKLSETNTLLRFLYRHGHSTPFEMGELLYIVKCPMDVSRQLIRHRAASMMEEGSMFDEPSINEYSTRYSLAMDDALRTPPDGWRAQATDNKQGSGAFIENGAIFSAVEHNHNQQTRRLYEERLARGVAREQARKDLPLSTYTQFYLKCDLRNLLHFLSLRLDSHAQYEIRQYASAMAAFVKVLFPLTWGAFEEYDTRRNGLALTASDLAVIRQLAYGEGFVSAIQKVGWTVEGKNRERDECRAKLVRMGLISQE